MGAGGHPRASVCLQINSGPWWLVMVAHPFVDGKPVLLKKKKKEAVWIQVLTPRCGSGICNKAGFIGVCLLCSRLHTRGEISGVSVTIIDTHPI